MAYKEFPGEPIDVLSCLGDLGGLAFHLAIYPWIFDKLVNLEYFVLLSSILLVSSGMTSIMDNASTQFALSRNLSARETSPRLPDRPTPKEIWTRGNLGLAIGFIWGAIFPGFALHQTTINICNVKNNLTVAFSKS